MFYIWIIFLQKKIRKKKQILEKKTKQYRYNDNSGRYYQFNLII